MIGARCFDGLLIDRTQLPGFIEQPLLVGSATDSRFTEDHQPMLRFVRFLEHDTEARDELFPRACATGRVVVRRNARPGANQLFSNLLRFGRLR